MRWVAAAAAAAVVVTSSGCGVVEPEIEVAEPRPAAAAPEPCRPVDTSVFGAMRYDVDPADSLADLLQRSRGSDLESTVVSGHVGGWLLGPPGHALARVEVDEVLVPGDRPELVQDATAWIPFWRGERINGVPEREVGLGQHARAVPEGTRLVALLDPAPPAQQRWAARALSGDPVLAATPGPEDVFLDDCDTVVNALDSSLPPGPEFRSDLDTLVAAIRDLRAGR